MYDFGRNFGPNRCRTYDFVRYATVAGISFGQVKVFENFGDDPRPKSYDRNRAEILKIVFVGDETKFSYENRQNR